ncbi:hypothetical protein H4S08_003188, partial [Coemansia sp. RSA 1365]
FNAIYGYTPAEFDRSYTTLNSPSYGSQFGNGIPSGNFPGIHPSATHPTDPSMDVGSFSAPNTYANTMGTPQESFYYNYMSSLNNSQSTYSGANTGPAFIAEHRTPIIAGQPSVGSTNEGFVTENLQNMRSMGGDSPNSLSNVPLIEHPGFSSTNGGAVAINNSQDFSGTNPMLDFYIQQQTSYSMPNFPNSTMLTSAVSSTNADALLTRSSANDNVYTDLMSQFSMMPNVSTVGEGNMNNLYNTSENIGYADATHAQQWQQQMVGLDGSGIRPELTISPASAAASNRNTDFSSTGSQP